MSCPNCNSNNVSVGENETVCNDCKHRYTHVNNMAPVIDPETIVDIISDITDGFISVATNAGSATVDIACSAGEIAGKGLGAVASCVGEIISGICN